MTRIHIASPLRPLSVLIAVGAVLAVLTASGLGQWLDDDGAEGDVLMTLREDRITIDVRNGGGVAGMARAATDHLRESGFDVVSLGNASTFGHDATVVTDRVGDTETAAAVARALGVERVESVPDSNLFVDVSVLLGADWSAPSQRRASMRDDLQSGVIEWLRGLGRDRANR